MTVFLTRVKNFLRLKKLNYEIEKCKRYGPQAAGAAGEGLRQLLDIIVFFAAKEFPSLGRRQASFKTLRRSSIRGRPS
jgi:hypothetical protein